MDNKSSNNTSYPLYICYYCLQYKTHKKNDMEKHLQKKKRCQLTYTPYKIFDFEEAYKLSLNNKYYFLFDYSKLTFKDYIYIINKFHETVNYINYTDIIKNDVFLQNNITDFISKIFNKENNQNMIIKSNEIIHSNNDSNNNSNNGNIINDNIILKNNSFECKLCGKQYKSKQALLKHIKNKTLCENTQLLNNMIKKSEQKNVTELVEYNKTLQQGIVNNFNQNNQNNNIQNNYNNTTPSIKLNIKDFGSESYSYAHIHPSYMKQDDFYLYTNFLNKLLENEKNQNILFLGGNENLKSENRKAIIYADEILYNINEDKAIYMILQKLNISMKNFIYDNYNINTDKEKIEEIEKYYRVITGHFKHDTLFKKYYIDDKQYYYPSHRRRSRDVYTTVIKNVFHKYGTPLSQLINNDTNIALETFHPDIEDYASTRVRNKDLKKRKDELL